MFHTTLVYTQFACSGLNKELDCASFQALAGGEGDQHSNSAAVYHAAAHLLDKHHLVGDLDESKRSQELVH